MTIPSVSLPHPDVTRVLKRYDQRLDLHILPNGTTWLLYKSDSPARIQEGRKQLEEQRGDGLANDRAALLMAAGYELLSEETFIAGNCADYLVRVAHQKLTASKFEIEQEINRLIAISDGTADRLRAIAVLSDRIRSEANSDHRLIYQGKKSFAKVM